MVKVDRGKKRGERSQLAVASSDGLIDSRRLFYFYNVAKAGSFTATETVLDVAQSALTRQVRQLETDLDVTLFQRDGRGVRLTEAGKILFSRAESILADMSASTAEVRLSAQQPTVRVRIATPPMFAERYMAPVIERFVLTNPKVHVDLRETSTGGVYDLLTSGEVSVGIVMLSANSTKLRLQRLLEEPLLVVAGPGHPIAASKFVTRDDLTQLDLVLPPSPHGTRAVVNKYLKDIANAIQPGIETDSLAVMKQLLASNRRCAIMPKSSCDGDVAGGRLIARELRPHLARTSYVATVRGKGQPPGVAALISDILAVVQGGRRRPPGGA